MRKILVALAATLAIGAAAISSEANAQARWHGGGGGHWHGGGGWHGGGHWHGGGWHGGGWGWGWPAVGFGVGLGAGYYGGYYGYPYYSGGCWRSARVGTPYGWRWRRVWVCG